MSHDPIVQQIAAELQVRPAQVAAAVTLLDGGATVPFVARYRKEATGGLDDVHLRTLETRLAALRELAARREVVLRTIDGQGRLTPELRAAIEAAPTRQALEDLYLPFKPRRRTKGQIAREAGLEPLADRLFGDPTLDPAAEAAAFAATAPGGAAALAEAGFGDAAALLDGVRDLLSERWAEDAALVGALREWLWADGLLRSRLVDGRDGTQPDAARFRDYFEYDEPIARVPSHRALAVFRGRALEVLDARLVLPEPAEPPVPPPPGARAAPTPGEQRVARHVGWQPAGRPGDELIRRCVAWAWKVKLAPALERDLFARLREQAEGVAIQVFAGNLRDLLLAAPAGPRVVMGLDPGIRTGVKVAVVGDTGRVLETATVYPHEPRND
nr:RNA-binding transcriptional accessory protein [Rubrivivax sp.]